MSGGGGGGSSTTAQNIPEELKPLASRFARDAIAMSDRPFESFGGQRFADLNSTQNAGIQTIQNRALGGDATVNAGANFLQGQLASGPGEATRNPFGAVQGGTNASTVSAGENPFAGQNPFLQGQIDSAMGDVTRNFNQTVAPGIASANANSGSFGNSGVAEMASESQRQLASELGRVSSGMRFQDASAQQGLAESALNRGMAAQQFNSGVTDANIGRDFQAQQFNAGMGQDFASRNDAAFQSGIGNRMNAAQMGLSYGNQAFQDGQQLLNAGRLQQDQNQQGLDFNFQQFQDRQNDPFKRLAAMSGAFQGAPGQSSTTTSTGGGK